MWSEAIGEAAALASKTSAGRFALSEIGAATRATLGCDLDFLKVLDIPIPAARTSFSIAPSMSRATAELLEFPNTGTATGSLGRLVGEQALSRSQPLGSAEFPMSLRGADLKYHFDIGGETRAINVHLPPRFNPSKPTPVYFLADGAQYGTPEGEMLQGYRWAQTADRNNFVAVALAQSERSGVAVPEKIQKLITTNSSWRSPYNFLGPSETVDDVNYVQTAMAGVAKSMRVKDVNLVGFCDGGLLCEGVASKVPVNGLAKVASTTFEDSPSILPGSKTFIANMADDNVLASSGGAGKSFGRFLVQAGYDRILASQPALQAPRIAAVNALREGSLTETADGLERTWLSENGAVRMVQQSINKGGHNWPGTEFSKLSQTHVATVAPEKTLQFNQKIVDLFGKG